MKTIYRAINHINGKSYIGKTIQDFKWYSSNHISRALQKVDVKFNNERAFYRAIRKYGENNFKWNILWQGECSDNWLNELEKYYIYFYDTFGKNGYNMTEGGDGFSSENHPLKGKIRSKEHTRKIVESKKGFRHSEKTKREYSENRKGKKHPYYGRSRSKETKIKISNSLIGKTKGKNNPMYGRKRTGTSAGNKNKYLLISPNKQLIGAYGNLRFICEKYGFVYKTILKWINKGIIKNSKYNKFKNQNIIGWEIITI